LQQAATVRWSSALLLVALAGCDPAGSTPRNEVAEARHTSAPAPALTDAPGYDPDWRPRATARAQTRAEADPLRGRFTLADATADLKGSGPLVAEIATTLGTLHCTLMPERAPRAVAQFVGLANGRRPHRSRRGWVKEPAYDGSHLHRVVPGALVVGGRPVDAHPDGIGLVAVPEIWPGMPHDEAGLLCSAGRGRMGAGELLLTGSGAPSSAKADAGPQIPTVFGRCEPVALIDRISRVPSARGRPREAVVLERVRVTRRDPSRAEPSPTTGK